MQGLSTISRAAQRFEKQVEGWKALDHSVFHELPVAGPGQNLVWVFLVSLPLSHKAGPQIGEELGQQSLYAESHPFNCWSL